MSGYVNQFDETEYMSFQIKDEKLQKVYNWIWNRVCNIVKEGFDSEPMYNEKY